MLEIFLNLSDEEYSQIFQALLLSAQLAFFSSAILLVLCTPIAWYLARTTSLIKFFLQAILCLPLVLPPSVLGFYLLILMSPESFFGKLWVSVSDSQLLFSFPALLIASVVYSLPFALQPIQSGFEKIDEDFIKLAKNLGANKWDRFVSVILPLNKRAYIVAMILAFAHTLGEFGVVLLVGGNIAGETRVISIAIYDQVEMLNYDLAHVMALLMLVISLILLIPVYALNGSLMNLSWPGSAITGKKSLARSE
jgi:molybdate transport system permease protein